jgi:hypothetical protein
MCTQALAHFRSAICRYHLFGCGAYRGSSFQQRYLFPFPLFQFTTYGGASARGFPPSPATPILPLACGLTFCCNLFIVNLTDAIDRHLSGHFPSMLPNTSLSAPPLRRPHAVTLPFHTGSFSTPFPCFSPELLAFSQHWEHLPTPPIDLHEFFLAAGGCTPPERGGSLAFAPASSFDPPQSMCFSQSFPHHRSLLRPLSVAILRPAPLSFPLISSPIPLCALFSLSSPLHQSSQYWRQGRLLARLLLGYCPSLSRSPKYGSECDSLCVSRCTSPSVLVARHPLPFPTAPQRAPNHLRRAGIHPFGKKKKKKKNIIHVPCCTLR